MTELILIAIFTLSLAFSAVFSGLETALISLDKVKLHHESESGNLRARAILSLINKIDLLISSCLIGNNITIVTASTMIGTIMALYRWEEGWTSLAIVAAETSVFLIFGEIMPKAYFRSNANKFVSRALPLLRVMIFIFYPILQLINKVNRILLKDKIENTLSISREEVEHLFQMGSLEGVIDNEGSDYIQDIFEFSETTAREIMIPTINMVACEIKRPLSQLARLIHEHGYNRIPVYDERVDNILGYVSSRQLMDARKTDNIQDLTQKTQYIPFTKKISELFAEMKSLNLEMVFVVNEFGAVAGLITIEDIVEEIIGEIQTMDHPEEQPIQKLNNGNFLVDGIVNVDDFNKFFSTDIRKHGFETISGFLAYKLGKIPRNGEKIRWEDWELIAEETSPTAVKKVKVTSARQTVKKS